MRAEIRAFYKAKSKPLLSIVLDDVLSLHPPLLECAMEHQARKYVVDLALRYTVYCLWGLKPYCYSYRLMCSTFLYSQIFVDKDILASYCMYSTQKTKLFL
jgi:hypothetical protein